MSLDQVEALLAHIHDGLHLEVAASLAGISHARLRKALLAGQQEHERGADTPCAAFYETLARAQAEPEAEAVKSLRRAGQVDWRAQQAYLQARYPARWAPRVRIEVTKEVERIFDALQATFSDRPDLLREIFVAISTAQESQESELEGFVDADAGALGE